MNWFADPDVARRYSASRPYFHPIVVSRFCDVASAKGDLRRGLDVACGTGQSAHALCRAVGEVVAVDAALEMLRHACRYGAIRVGAALAEWLPFRPEAFDVLSVGLGCHWFERTRFLAEAMRVLRSRGWLLIYDNWFPGRMCDNPDFAGWFHGSYLQAYPSPPRDRRPFSTAEARATCFDFVLREQFSNRVTWRPGELVAYLCTQTNVESAAGHDSSMLMQIERSLSEQVAPFFAGNPRTFEFDGFIWILRKVV